MQRRTAFTLMELLVSISLLTLIVLLMYGTISSSKIANTTLAKHTQKEHNKSMLYTLIYQDLWESISIRTVETSDKHFTLVELQTRNSLYNITAPYVTYFVNSQTQQLIRLEAARKIDLPISFENEYKIKADTLLYDVSDFNLYKNSDTQTMTTENLSDNLNSLSSSDDKNSSDLNSTSILGSYLLYINNSKHTAPMLMELSF